MSRISVCRLQEIFACPHLKMDELKDENPKNVDEAEFEEKTV